MRWYSIANVVFFLIRIATKDAADARRLFGMKRFLYSRLGNRVPTAIAPKMDLLNFPKLKYGELTEQDKFDLQWYVVGKPDDFMANRPEKVRVWNKNYVIWRTANGEYRAMDDACTHKGASLSGGKICNDHVVCPYHGYEFNSTGTLVMVPGISFDPSPIYNLRTYPIVVKNNWVYINTQPNDSTTESFMNTTYFYTEPEIGEKCSLVQLDMEYDCYSRILSENSLDIMHIAFVHTFGNAKRPDPIREEGPALVAPNHYMSRYFYEAGENSLARKMFGVKELTIENEFILPHTTVARIIFGDFVSTVITFALPLGNNKSKLFVKTYRNFWPNQLGDLFTYNSMYTTMLQDKAVVEGIDPEFMDGKFNMKFDKLQNTYKTVYNRFVHSVFNGRRENNSADQ
jgi:hypothetical protein